MSEVPQSRDERIALTCHATGKRLGDISAQGLWLWCKECRHSHQFTLPMLAKLYLEACPSFGMQQQGEQNE